MVLVGLAVWGFAPGNAWGQIGRPTAKLPADFVYLRQIDQSIEQDIRYASDRNFTGQRVAGYEAAECILLRDAALALKQAQADLNKQGFRFKVYDCYRPQRSVQSFLAWAQARSASATRLARHHPSVPRDKLVERGYIAPNSQHSTGAAVDLTIVALSSPVQPVFDPDGDFADCTADKARREPDNSEDAGTGFDCFDIKSHSAAANLSSSQQRVRKLMIDVLAQHGFANYSKEWWHFRYVAARGVLRAHDFVVGQL